MLCRTVALALVGTIVTGVEICGPALGGGVCPDKNTCCPALGRSGCIPNDLGAFNATCCSDNKTGCAVGYTCGPRQQCLATETVHDPLVQVLPRYVLCHPPQDTLTKVHGLSVGAKEGELAYYSTEIDLQLDHEWPDINVALVMVHGAGRNADDYFCSATAAAELQTIFHESRSVLVVAPRFLGPSDGPVTLTSGGTPLRWNDQGPGPWRYGASAISPPLATNVSSYDAMDQLVRELNNETKFPNLKHITVAGHSSGGQFVQRWSLLTSSWHKNENQRVHLRAVVANPSSYAYLAEYRFQDGAWRMPSSSLCPQYNEWEWGFGRGGELHVPYRDRALEQVHNNVSQLAARFATRDIIYLAGSLDRCNVTKPTGWCNSHGLETSCMDELQGSNRWERNDNYFASLKRLGITTHKRFVVDGVGHDHSLIFASPTGILALFGSSAQGEDQAASS